MTEQRKCLITDQGVAALQEVLEYIEEHPEQWNQREWWCESAGCVAGHLIARSAQFRYDVDDLPVEVKTQHVWTAFGAALNILMGASFMETSRSYLGSPSDAIYVVGQLFTATNSLSDLWRIADEISGGRVKRPTFKGITTDSTKE